MTKYAAILADPPWTFQTRSPKGRDRCPDARHYDVMSLADILAMRPMIDRWAAPDCVLFLWVTFPMLEHGLHVIEAWGFTYRTCGFTWAKTQKTDESRWSLGLGYWTRSNAEICLLAGRGSPKRKAKDVPQLIVSPRREHSRKPDEARERIERLVAGPYLELFARGEARPGWSVWGNEAENAIEAPRHAPVGAADVATVSPS